MAEISQREHEPQAVLHLSQKTGRQRAHSLREEAFVERNELRHVNHRIAEESCVLACAENIPRRRREFHIGGYGSDHDGLNAAGVELIGLNDQNRTPISRTGPDRTRQPRPRQPL